MIEDRSAMYTVFVGASISLMLLPWQATAVLLLGPLGALPLMPW